MDNSVKIILAVVVGVILLCLCCCGAFFVGSAVLGSSVDEAELQRELEELENYQFEDFEESN